MNTGFISRLMTAMADDVECRYERIPRAWGWFSNRSKWDRNVRLEVVTFDTGLCGRCTAKTRRDTTRRQTVRSLDKQQASSIWTHTIRTSCSLVVWHGAVRAAHARHSLSVTFLNHRFLTHSLAHAADPSSRTFRYRRRSKPAFDRRSYEHRDQRGWGEREWVACDWHWLLFSFSLLL